VIGSDPIGAGAASADSVLATWDQHPASLLQRPAGGHANRDDLTTYLIPLPPPVPGPIPPDQIESANRVRAKADEIARQAHGAQFRRLDALTQSQVYFEALRQLGIED
jgi:hypothetical protein